MAELTWPLTGPQVSAWISARTPGGPIDAELLDEVIASVSPFVETARPEFWSTPAPTPTEPAPAREYHPDAEVWQAARMLAARVLRRRASPGGIESFGDGGIAGVQYVARFDPEIERALRLGGYQRPEVL